MAMAALLAASTLVVAPPARADHVGQQLLSTNTPTGIDDQMRVSPDGRWAIYPADVDGRIDLWLVSTEDPTDAPRRVNPAVPGQDVYAYEFSADSAYVLFVGSYEVDATRRPLYSRPVTLAEPATRLSEHTSGNSDVWYDFVSSADGTYVVYQGDLTVDGQRDVYSTRVDGTSTQVRLSSDPVPGGEVLLGSLRVAPDASRVIYRGTLDDNAKSELYSAPIATAGQQIRLNDTPGAGGNVLFPEITPDSTRVVYRGDLKVDGQQQLFSARIDQEGTEEELSVSASGGGVFAHEISPDGQVVIYRGALDVLNETELYRRAVDGSDAQQQVNAPFADPASDVFGIAIAPDGEHVAYTADAQVDEEIALYVRPLDLSGPVVRVSAPGPAGGDVEQFAFTHDSSRLAYEGQLDVAMRDDVYSRPVDLSGPQVRVSEWATDVNVTELIVAPDDTRVVYAGDGPMAGTHELFSAPIATPGQQVQISATAHADGNVDRPVFRWDSSAVVYEGDLEVDNIDEVWVSTRGQRPPVAPSGLAVDDVTDGSALVSWTAPPASQVDDYTITATATTTGSGAPRAAAATVTTTVTGMTTGTSITLTDMSPDTTYRVSVQANNHGGAGGTVGPVAFTTLSQGGVVRLSGPDRYETAVAVALDRFDPADVDTVYLAVGSNFPDALAGGPLAAQDGAPILLVRTDSLPDVVGSALGTLGPSRVVALGGGAAISQAVLDAAADAAGAGTATDRIAGDTRYDTAAAIAAALDTTGVDTAFLATGTNFPDALAGGPATGGAPILLTLPGSLPSATAAALDDLGPATVTALGGVAAVAEDTLTAAGVAAGGASTDRLSGADRFLTATAIAQSMSGVDTVYVAVGTNFPDALAAGPAAFGEGAPIVLTRTDALPDTTVAYLDGIVGLRRIVVLGGVGAISDEVAVELAGFVD